MLRVARQESDIEWMLSVDVPLKEAEKFLPSWSQSMQDDLRLRQRHRVDGPRHLSGQAFWGLDSIWISVKSRQ